MARPIVARFVQEGPLGLRFDPNRKPKGGGDGVGVRVADLSGTLAYTAVQAGVVVGAVLTGIKASVWVGGSLVAEELHSLGGTALEDLLFGQIMQLFQAVAHRRPLTLYFRAPGSESPPAVIGSRIPQQHSQQAAIAATEIQAPAPGMRGHATSVEGRQPEDNMQPSAVGETEPSPSSHPEQTARAQPPEMQERAAGFLQGGSGNPQIVDIIRRLKSGEREVTIPPTSDLARSLRGLAGETSPAGVVEAPTRPPLPPERVEPLSALGHEDRQEELPDGGGGGQAEERPPDGRAPGVHQWLHDMRFTGEESQQIERELLESGVSFDLTTLLGVEQLREYARKFAATIDKQVPSLQSARRHHARRLPPDSDSDDDMAWAVFSALDTNGDGLLSPNELREGLASSSR